MAIFKRKAAGPADLAAPSSSRRSISLALQGGGAHGAFQWGVLDRLLEDDTLDIKAVSGVSAGAMNGAALVSGLTTGGSEGGRAALDKLWREVNQSGGRNVFGDSAIWNAASPPEWLKDNPFWRAGETLAMTMSPYEFNPLNHNPMNRVLKASVDFEAVRGSDIRLFVAATAVRQAKTRLFTSSEISADVLMASACLPHLFQAVEIDGEPYWDGGYLTNPPLWPLTGEDTPDDVLLVTLNPMLRDETPKSSGDIVDRLNEIVFNAPLVAELRALAMAEELAAEGSLKPGAFRTVRLHAIEADGWLNDLALRTKFNTEWTFLNDLKARGRAAADDWLNTCRPTVGLRASVDLQARFA
ncbi:patatin-like phospholipase family protein [Brevundimonas nasdae]|uniref:Patatin-like phospholipase family protein n=2 Tax=Brevundimonas nasdae TaxID=172043 RepID=A0ABX8TLV1_9CAUL|nr:patatin-like phospholipase family protein [Brevundimonas nasdae]QYC14123.1 patatin-like phospholipase family protein [Brevundimonas nasdae]